MSVAGVATGVLSGLFAVGGAFVVVPALVLAIIGAINWGLVAIAEFDLVAEIFGLEFGETNTATRIIYGLVGLAGVILVVTELAVARRPAERHERVTVR